MDAAAARAMDGHLGGGKSVHLHGGLRYALAAREGLELLVRLRHAVPPHDRLDRLCQHLRVAFLRSTLVLQRQSASLTAQARATRAQLGTAAAAAGRVWQAWKQDAEGNLP